MTKRDETRALRERIHNLELRNAHLEGAIDKALQASSHDEARYVLRRALGGARGTWDAESIVGKAKEWAALYGSPPAASDWNPANARYHNQLARLDRYFAGDWPGTTTVLRYFDSWNAMVAAAGFPLREPGGGSMPGANYGARHTEHLPIWDGWEFVRGFRTRRGLSQVAVAKASAINISYVRAIERGKQTNPSVRILLALAQPLGVRPGAFFE